jgi:cobalt-zinc-cadmium efflux system protein
MTTHDHHQHSPEGTHSEPHHPHDHHHAHQHHHHTQVNLFFIPFVLTLVFALVEFYGGIWAKSLALLGDSWHMFSDVAALGLAMYAAHRAGKAKARNQQSRAEIIASIINAVIMVVVIIWIVVEAIDRLNHPKPVASGVVMLIAFLGLVVNIIVAQRLHGDHGAEDNLNHRAALLHVLGDLLGSVAALLAGVVIYFTGWLAVDPILSIVISILLCVGTFNLIQAIRRSLQQTEKS